MKKNYQYVMTFVIAFVLLYAVDTNAQTFKLKGTQITHVDEKTSSTNKSAQNKFLSKTFKRYDVFKMNVKDLSVYVKSNAGTATFDLDLGESYQWNMKIEPVDLYSPTAKAFELTENGEVEIPLSRDILFKGSVNGKKSTQVRLTLNNDKLDGLVIINDEKFYIESLQNLEKSSDKSHYIVYKASDIVDRPDIMCQATKDSHADDDVHKKMETNKATAACSGQLENQIATYASYRRFSAAGGTSQVNNEILTILNNVQANYNEYNIKLVVTEQKVATCSSCNPWGDLDYDITSLLGRFASWAPTGFSNTHDQGICFIDGPGSGVVGYAYVGSICTANRYAVCDKLSSSSQDRVLVAHEMGHNFGANHDAAGSGYIMAPSVNATNTWSSQSISSIRNHIASRSCLACITGTPPPPPTVCYAPTGLAVQNLAATTATLKWNAVTSATGYVVELKTVNESNWQSFDSSGNSLDLSSFETGVTYQWRVKTNCSGSASATTTNGPNFTPIGTTTPPPTTCTAPTGLAVKNLAATTATLQWNAVTAATGYVVELKTINASTWQPFNSTSNSLALSAFETGVTYQWRVKTSCSASSNSATTNGPNFTPGGTTTPPPPSACAAPASASASNIGSTSATLNWATTSAPNYYIYIQPNGGNWYLQTQNYTGTSYNLTGLAAGQTYTVDVYANCPGKAVAKRFTFTTSSNPSGCGSPTNTRIVTQSNGLVQLGWNAVSGANNYNVQLKASTSSNWQVFSIANNNVSFSGLQVGVIYQWRVSSNCTNGTSSYTNGPDISGYATSTAEFSVMEEEGGDLKVYPNPSNANFTLQMQNSTSEFADVVVTNTAGQVVYKASKIDAKAPFVFGDQLATGIYIVKFIAAEKTTVTKVIKQ